MQHKCRNRRIDSFIAMLLLLFCLSCVYFVKNVRKLISYWSKRVARNDVKKMCSVCGLWKFLNFV